MLGQTFAGVHQTNRKGLTAGSELEIQRLEILPDRFPEQPLYPVAVSCLGKHLFGNADEYLQGFPFRQWSGLVKKLERG